MCASKFASKSSKARSRLASIQLDESTDSALESHLIVFTQYKKDRKMKEEFLFSNTLSATATALFLKQRAQLAEFQAHLY